MRIAKRRFHETSPLTITECSFNIKHMRTRDFDKQRRIKESMVRLILRDGLGGASVAKIARDAGVSPATIYVYYESKEAMVAEVFQECSRDSFDYLQRMLRPGMDGGQLIEAIVRGYYAYTVEHEEIFSFVEQCSRCPGVSEAVSEPECCCGIFDLIHEYQRQGILNRYSDQNYAAVLFAPVRFLATERSCGKSGAEEQLSELVRMLQRMLVAR